VQPPCRRAAVSGKHVSTQFHSSTFAPVDQETHRCIHDLYDTALQVINGTLDDEAVADFHERAIDSYIKGRVADCQASSARCRAQLSAAEHFLEGSEGSKA